MSAGVSPELTQTDLDNADAGVKERVKETAGRAWRVNYDGQSWRAMDENGNEITLMADDALTLPELPGSSQVNTLLLPVERVLSRIFSLPLSNPRFIDQDILAQELEEYTAEQADDWWLVWQAGRSDGDGSSDGGGVSGMMFGLPESLRQQIDVHPAWQQLHRLGVDIWERLSAQRRVYAAIAIDEQESAGDVGSVVNMAAVFDVDSSGVFFGVWHGQAGDDDEGYWRGMRRLNWPEGALLSESQCSALAQDIDRSLLSMGWQHEGAGSVAIGNLSLQLHAALVSKNEGAFNTSAWHGAIIEPADLLSRHAANLALSPDFGLNFRFGRWRSQHGFGQLKPWYRSFAIAAALVVVWAAGMMWQNHQLDVQRGVAEQRVIQAFHKGLPHETVMIDALAQLRKAAGGSSSGPERNSAVVWLQRMQSVQRVYQQTPWKIKTLSLENGHISMSGSIADLQTMNKIRQALQQEMGVPVKVRDTDLSGQQVQFRMAW